MLQISFPALLWRHNLRQSSRAVTKALNTNSDGKIDAPRCNCKEGCSRICNPPCEFYIDLSILKCLRIGIWLRITALHSMSILYGFIFKSKIVHGLQSFWSLELGLRLRADQCHLLVCALPDLTRLFIHLSPGKEEIHFSGASLGRNVVI